MGIKHYGPGEHPGGFVGFRVTRLIGEEYLQKYLSTAAANTQSEDDIYYRYRHLQALYQDTEWEAESILRQYRNFVTTNSGNTKPLRGLNLHGITASFIRSGNKWEPCFTVSRPGKKPQKRFLFWNQSYSDAWEKAVTLWAEEHQILEEDRARVLESSPDPEQFKRLRRQMNDHEGFDISVEALGPVFKDQREQLANQRLVQRAAELKLQTPSPAPVSKDTEAEMMAWFEKERQRAS